MKIDLCISSVIPMLDFLRALKSGQATKNQISDIFNHSDYDFEFRRYEISSKEPIIKYFAKLNSIGEAEIPILNSERKNMFREKHNLWLAAYDNPELYEEMYEKIISFITNETLENICLLVKKGLPINTDINKIRIISTMSIGTSFGYVFDNALHFDMMGFDKGSLETLPSLLAHEIHHLAMWDFVSTFINTLTLEERFVFSFSGEGLAVKFCNNAKGTISKEIYNNRPVNEGLDAFSMNYLNERFYECLEVFEDTLKKIRLNEMNKEDVFKQLEDYWWNPYTDEQSRDDKPLLKHSRIYSFGNDLYGAIYDAFGSEILFDCIIHPLKAVEYFNTIKNRAVTEQ